MADEQDPAWFKDQQAREGGPENDLPQAPMCELSPASSSGGLRKFFGFQKKPPATAAGSNNPEMSLTAEALASHQQWLNGQQQAGGLPPPPPSHQTDGNGNSKVKSPKSTSLFGSVFKKKEKSPLRAGVSRSGGGGAPPPSDRPRHPQGDEGDEDDTANMLSGGGSSSSGGPAAAGGGSALSNINDALFAKPAGDDALDALASGGGGSSGANHVNNKGGGNGGDVDNGSDGGESASGSEESEAEGEFKGGRGDALTARYTIEKEVGRGTFGRVLRCLDKHATNSEHEKVAVKVVHDAGRYYELSLIEAEILRDVNGAGGRGTTHCCVLLNFFKLDGHACMVFETLGQSLYEFLKANDYIPFPLYCVQDFSRQMLEAIDFLHSMKLVHTDLKPENVLLVSNEFTVQQVGKKQVRIPKSTRIKLIDFGCATYDDDKHKSELIATRQYRAPEVIMSLPWSFPSDIWSVGCIVAELYCGDQLFETHSNMEHVALIERGIDKWPKSLLSKSPHKSKYFDKHALSLWRTALDADGRRHVRAMKTLEEFVGADKDTGLLSLFRALLTIDPKKRISASRALTKSFVRQRTRKA